MRPELATLEAVLFASAEPLEIDRLAEIMGCAPSETRARLGALEAEYRTERRGIVLVASPEGYRLATSPREADAVARLAPERDPRLTPASLETLAVIALKQPITRAEVETFRGVASDHLIRTLEERGLIRTVGHRKVPGNPRLMGTTPEFFRYFGIADDSVLDRFRADLEAALPESSPVKRLFEDASPDAAASMAAETAEAAEAERVLAEPPSDTLESATEPDPLGPVGLLPPEPDEVVPEADEVLPEAVPAGVLRAKA